MKTCNCIIKLTLVPDNIYVATDGDIDKGMYLQRGAVDCLLNGEMFSGLDCMWRYATLIEEEEAKQVVRQLLSFGMVGEIVKIL